MEEINEVSFQNALNQLSPQQNQILHLVFYQNLTIEEASEIMKIQIGTARTHYERGKRQLKKRLIINQNFQQ
jgi:RNA polymerase sigma-70 factor (ECF subfamily)